MKLFLDFTDDGTVQQVVIEKRVGGTVVYHRHTDDAGALQPIPLEITEAITWAITTLTTKVDAYKDMLLAELHGIPVEKLAEARAALAVLKDV